jgi:23S rRNA (guanine745-N1)-methyltransferase
MSVSFLACSVRGCAQDLVREGATWRCVNRHAFDVARSGYLNLIQPQDRRSLQAGDNALTVAARRALLDGGYGTALRDALVSRALTLDLPNDALVLDLACGEGHYLAALCEHAQWTGCGLDLSAWAVESAARRHPALTWVAANADRRLPLIDASFDLVMSTDGRRPRDECARVLKPNGALLIAVPAARDLIELRTAVLAAPQDIDRVARVQAELAPTFQLIARQTVEQTHTLDRGALAQLSAATYRNARRSEQVKLDALDQLDVTTAHDVLVFARS